MAVGYWSSNARLAKAVFLPPLIVILLAMAAGVSSTEDGPVAEADGRFGETLQGRKLLTVCRKYFPFAKNVSCRPNPYGIPYCLDVGSDSTYHCGSCTTKCKVGELCCSGVCADLTSDKNNCGICGNKCTGSNTCKLGFCKY